MSLFQGTCERHWLRRATGAVLAAGAIVLTAPGTSASGTSTAANGLAASGMCPNVRAGGHNYDVHALNVACSFADRWASSLAGRRLKAGAENVEIPSGPRGTVARRRRHLSRASAARCRHWASAPNRTSRRACPPFSGRSGFRSK
jgi:hypothetical protein